MGNYIDSSWKNIAEGHTAFCILGGPSVTQVKDIQDIIQNNFTITLNHNIDLKTNGNIDTNQVVQAFKNTDVQQGMVGALKEAIYSNGLMAPTANKTQLMNSNISASSLV